MHTAHDANGRPYRPRCGVASCGTILGRWRVAAGERYCAIHEQLNDAHLCARHGTEKRPLRNGSWACRECDAERKRRARRAA